MIPAKFVYLESCLSPLRPFLSRKDISDIYVNKPGEVWVETASGEMEHHIVTGLSRDVLERLLRQIAASSSQAISRTYPLLSAPLPTGERMQAVIPPATRGDIAIAIRKKAIQSFDLHDLEYDSNGPIKEPCADIKDTDNENISQFLIDAVNRKKNILISGGTSSGKTTLLNTLIRIIPKSERLIFIEDTPELDIAHDNVVGMLAQRNDQREAGIDMEDLLIAALRMRPNRIILGEVRGGEASTFLRAINTGHPGSITTIHANDANSALDQLAFLIAQSGTRLGWDDVHRYIRSTIDLCVHVSRTGGKIRCSTMNVNHRHNI